MEPVSPLLLRFAQTMDVSPDEVLRCAGVDRGALRTEGLSQAQGIQLWVAMETLTGDPFVGLTAGTRLTLDLLGMVGLAFATASDLADGLHVAARVIGLMIPGAAIEVRQGPGGAGVHYRTERPDVRHGVDSIFAGIVALARECGGKDIGAARVELQCPAPTSPLAYVRALGVAPEFSRPSCALWFDAATLRRRFRGAEPATSQLLRSNAAELVQTQAGKSPRADLEGALLRSIDEGQGTLLHVASLLEQSPRTVQRRLREAGTTFQEQRTIHRRRRAEEWLRDSVPVTEVAARLGYASPAAFARAFRAWTGLSPTAFRSTSTGET